MGKIIGFILLLVAMPLGLLALIVLIMSLHFHSATAPCIRTETKPVTIVQWKYLDIRFDWATTCVERYEGN